jgi:hypothetical protein
LKEERKRKARGEFVPPETESLTVIDVLDAYLSDLYDRGKRSIPSVACRIEKLKEAFGHLRAVDLRTGHIDDYRRGRLAQGINKATVDAASHADYGNSHGSYRARF